MLDDFDKVKMTMTIKDKTVELKYHFDYREPYRRSKHLQQERTKRIMKII